MDIGAWLHGLGLGQYETTFRESEIDAEVLPDLTEADLISSACRWGTAPQGNCRSRDRRNHQAAGPRAFTVA
jgi:hypothetical protein